MISRVKLTIFTAIIVLMAIFTGAQAATSNNTVGFEVEPVASSYQVNSKVSYFDLKLKPGQKTNIAVKVKNTSGKALTINTSAATATTNINGVVEYKEVKADKSIDLPANLSKLMTTKTPKIKLKKGETKTVTW